MKIHAFTDKGTIVCGLLFPSSTRLSSDKDMPAADKVTTRLSFVDCPDCRKKLGEPPIEDCTWHGPFYEPQSKG